MNESECASLLASVQWTDPTNLVSLAVLAFINVLVIVGNCLVIAAVLCSHKLRSVTNFFIVSLAVADLLVGLAVLPFSATWEVFKVQTLTWLSNDQTHGKMAHNNGNREYVTYPSQNFNNQLHHQTVETVTLNTANDTHYLQGLTCSYSHSQKTCRVGRSRALAPCRMQNLRIRSIVLVPRDNSGE
uniref:G-protein coupled receptors family 1 profile domain-containing protein n=1 Tax=Anopheles culicifacies TaxID=139723 RepID=A0A182M1Q4_9DIPT